MALFAVAIAIVFPDFPWSRAAGAQAFQLLLVLESIHARPKPVIGITDQLLLVHQPLKGLRNKFLFRSYVIENPLFENKESAIDSNRAVVDGIDSQNQVRLALLQRNQMIAEIGTDAEKAGNFVLPMKVVQLNRENKIASFLCVRPNLSYHLVSLQEGQANLVLGINAINNGSVRINGGFFF